jgi:D-alanyl-D-alanine dipeptidase
MPAAAKQTKVVTEFTDQSGKRWKVGDTYTPRNDQERQAAIAAGQVQEQPADPNAPSQ